MEVNTYLVKPGVLIQDLNDVERHPERYFVPVDSPVVRTYLHLKEEPVVNGAIHIRHGETVVLGYRYWDYVDMVWYRLMDLMEETLEKGSGRTWYPGMSIDLNMELISPDQLRFFLTKTKADLYREWIVPVPDFFLTLFRGARHFFSTLNDFDLVEWDEDTRIRLQDLETRVRSRFGT